MVEVATLDLVEILALIAVAAAAGTLGTMLGMGGGVFMVPLFSLLFGIPLTSAIAASAIAVVANSVSGSQVYLRNRYANVRLAYVLLMPISVGAVVGGLIATSIPRQMLSLLFAALLLVVAVLMIRGRRPIAPPAVRVNVDDPLRLEGRFAEGPAGDVVTYVPRRVRSSLPIATLAGLASGLFGIGGGPVQVPLMSLMMRVPVKAAASTSSFMVGMSATSSALIFYSRGHVHPQTTIIAVFGIVAGARIGTHLAVRVNAQVLISLLVAVLIFLSGSMFAESLGVL